jgi:hypothetical protein
VNVAQDENVEIRRVSVINNGNSPRVFALTSYAEIILAPQNVDLHHPAFNKLFIESEFLPKEQILLFRRRPRAANEKAIYLAHFFVSDDEDVNLTGYETDRARFLGRGGTTERPVVFSNAQASVLSGTTGATLDPICALQAEITIPAYQKTQVAFITVAANSRKEALEVANQVVAQRPNHMGALRSRGLINESLADAEADDLHLAASVAHREDSVRDWEAIARIDPSNQIAWNNLANPNDIKVDQVLRVAPPEDAPGVRTAAVVMPPDTTKIAPPAPKKTEPKGDKKPYTDADLKADKETEPPGGYVIGLGSLADLGREELTFGVRQALVDRCMRLYRDPPPGTAPTSRIEVGVSSLLIGVREEDGVVRFDFANGLDAAHPMAFEVPRADFDRDLLEHARSLGATLYQPETVTDVESAGAVAG